MLCSKDFGQAKQITRADESVIEIVMTRFVILQNKTYSCNNKTRPTFRVLLWFNGEDKVILAISI